MWRLLGELLSINVPWILEFSDVLKFELSLLTLTFSPSLTVVSRFLYLYSIEDKTPSLLVKQFSTTRNTQRDSQSYIEKREEGDSSDLEDKRETQKEREQSSH